MKWKNLFFSMALAIAAVALTILGVELGFRQILRLQGPRRNHFAWLTHEKKIFVPDQFRRILTERPVFKDPWSQIGALPPQTAQDESEREQGPLGEIKSIHQKKILSPSGVTLYDLTYHFDSYGRRVNPHQNPEAKHFIALLGCSFTFGQGLNEEESMPSQLSLLRPRDNVLNFGRMGAGPNDIYHEWVEQPFHGLDDMKGKSGILVYVLYDFQMQRLTCPRSCFSSDYQWIQEKPYYTLNKNGEILSHGNFKAGRPWRNWFYNLLGHSAFLNYFNIEYPFRYSKDDLILAAHLINGIEKKAKTFSHIEKSVLFIMPSLRTDFVNDLKTEARKEKIEVIDFSSFTYTDTSRFSIPFDGHPTAEQAWWNASLIHKGLDQNL